MAAMGSAGMDSKGMSSEGMDSEAMGSEVRIGLEGRVSSFGPASSCPLGPTGDHTGSRMTTRQSSSRHPHRSMPHPQRQSRLLPSTGTIATRPTPTTRMSKNAQGDGGQ